MIRARCYQAPFCCFERERKLAYAICKKSDKKTISYESSLQRSVHSLVREETDVIFREQTVCHKNCKISFPSDLKRLH
jgi:hypothetical protein